MALKELDPIEPIPSFERTVDGPGLAQVLHTLEMANSSGLLAVQGEEDLVSLTLRQGDICAADAMNHSMEDSLGEVLAQQGVLSPADYRAVMESSQMEEEYDLCSEALIATGKVERRVVLEAVRSQIQRQCLALMRWQECSLQWVLRAESPYQQGIVPLPISEILLQSIDELQQSGPLHVPTFDYETSGVLADDALQRVRPREPDDDLATVETNSGVLIGSPVEVAIVDRLSSGARVEQLLDSPGRQGWRVRYGLYRLSIFGQLRPDYDSAPSRPSMPKPLVESGAAGTGSSLLSFGNDDDLAELLGDDSPTGGGDALPTLDLDEGLGSDLDSGIGDSLDFAGGDEAGGIGELALDTFDSNLDADLRSGPVAAPGSQYEWDFEESSQESVTDPGPWIATLATWAAKALALILVLAFARQMPAGVDLSVVASAVPGLSAEGGDAAARARWAVQSVKLTGALEIYHLVHGAFPGDIEVLADLDLVSPGNLENDRGRRLAFELEGSGFRIDPLRPDAIGPLLEPVRGTIVGSFFLNPRYIEVEERSGPPPVRIVER